jgi:hypothetical protein
MAHWWFGKISKLSKSKLESLKKEITNKTMVGEFIGHKDCQHLVKYQRETIIFYAIVDNYSRKICCLPEESYKIFKTYGFDVVSNTTMGVYYNYDEVCDDLYKEYDFVAAQTIQAEEEGAVLYFIKRSVDHHDEVLSLCKLKTLEYRLFRKMREKLRNFATNKTQASSKQLIDRFYSESKDLVNDYKIPHSLGYYKDICITAFDLITRGSQTDQDYYIDLLMNEYITFIEKAIVETIKYNKATSR